MYKLWLLTGSWSARRASFAHLKIEKGAKEKIRTRPEKCEHPIEASLLQISLVLNRSTTTGKLLTMNVSQATKTALTNYSKTAGYLHWGTALPMMASVSAVLKAQQCPKKSQERQWWMHQHESFGLLTAMILVPRVAYRVISYKSYNVKPLPEIITGNSSIEHAAASTTQWGLHGFGIVCAVTGVGMNYLSGWGIPFFWTKVPGLEKTHKYDALTKKMFDVHKVVGNYGKYLIPLHIAGTTAHAATGQAVFTRINPFRKPV